MMQLLEAFKVCIMQKVLAFVVCILFILLKTLWCRFVDTQNSDVHRKKFNAFVSEELHLSAAPHKHPLEIKTTDRVTEASLLPHPDLAIHSWEKTKTN